ncbi:MAG: hypothetical protein K9H26_19680 [Prolixibacteraceae bacterium]|nr:hypothetical protein [Prolixibacteraceae bacterium]
MKRRSWLHNPNEKLLYTLLFRCAWETIDGFANMQIKLKDLDVWIRCRLRDCIWKHWKKPNKRMRSFIRMGIPKGQAYAWSRSSR